ACGVKQDVEEVVTRRVVAPESVFQPKGAVENRIVLLGCADLEPDAPKAAQGGEGGSGDVVLVVPDTTCAKGAPVGGDGGEDKTPGGEERPSPGRGVGTRLHGG